MNKTIFSCVLIFILLSCAANAELSPCSSEGLNTVVNKKFQMAYSDEDFLQINNIDLLKDVSQLKDLTCLQYLDATDRTVKGDIVNLKNLKNLEVFSLYSNPDVYGDICSLAEAVNLRSLKFAFDPKITGDISCLKNLNKLETFAMTHTQISGDLSVFANMKNLKAIYVSGTNLKGNICALSNLTNLEELGIADEYPGNPDITGDLSCLANLKKVAKVSLYNTRTTNCEQFTEDHPNIEQGGCSKESLKTLIDYAQKYEKKIGKETQTEVRGQPNYQQNNYPKNSDIKNKPLESENEMQYKEPISKESDNEPIFKESDNEPIFKESDSEPIFKESDNQNFLTKLINWFKGLFVQPLFRQNIDKDEVADNTGKFRPSENINQIRRQTGHGGCRSQAECDIFCDKPENRESCLKFVPPDGGNGDNIYSIKEESKNKENRPNLEQGGPGGCKSRTECETYCSKPENNNVCSEFAPSNDRRSKEQTPNDQTFSSPPSVADSKPVCRVSVLPSSKGTAPYEARICVDNPNERIQQEYQDYVDFDGDGNWDYQGSAHGCHSYKFLKQGTFSPKAKIINSKGIESDICQTTVTIS